MCESLCVSCGDERTKAEFNVTQMLIRIMLDMIKQKESRIQMTRLTGGVCLSAFSYLIPMEMDLQKLKLVPADHGSGNFGSPCIRGPTILKLHDSCVSVVLEGHGTGWNHHIVVDELQIEAWIYSSQRVRLTNISQVNRRLILASA